MYNLIDNNTTANLIAFVKNGKESFYCLAQVEYWIGEWWNGYVDLNAGTVEDSYFNFLKRFKLDLSNLKLSYAKLMEFGDPFKIAGNKPSLYIDFEQKHYVSNFYEQTLEKRLPTGWVGQFGNVWELIPEAYKYW